MNERLRKMVRLGIVERTVFGNKPPLEVVYVLPPFGRRFMGILDEVGQLQAALDGTTVPAPERSSNATHGRQVPALHPSRRGAAPRSSTPQQMADPLEQQWVQPHQAGRPPGEHHQRQQIAQAHRVVAIRVLPSAAAD